MSIISSLQTVLQLGYSVFASPAFVVANRISPTLHRALAAPLLSGPYSGKLVDHIWDLIGSLQAGRLDQESFISLAASRMQEAYASGELSPYLQMADERHENLDITLKRCMGFLPLKWWCLKVHFMAPGNVHDLHRHRAVISAQVVLRGKLNAEQFNLVAVDNEDQLHLQPVQDESLNGYQTLLSTDKYCNVHGFQPGPDGAVRFQFYLRGHTPFRKRFPKRGRHYVHLSGKLDASGLVIGHLGRTGQAGES